MTIGNLSSTPNQGGQHPGISNNPLQHNGPVATILKGQRASKEIFWELKGNLRKQTLFWKYLLSKLVHEGFHSVVGEELHALYLLHDRLSTCTDRGWVEKNSNWFTNSIRLFNYFTLYLGQRENPRCEFDRVAKNSFFTHGLMTPHAYFGSRTFLNVRNVLRKVNLALKKKPRPSNRIGVGYRDHGTARDVAFDGSPSWQEVAVAHLPPKSTNPTEENSFRTYLWKIRGRKIPYQFFSIDSSDSD